ncbi:hypothetical protein BVE84_02000 [Streptococcus azizii]|uniref:Uncharacterized protein n=1 Tax=Streptococcus azizii TaxID=1579424 RepID=A0AB36JS98_9STRE|nr:hypothetical protein BVE86_00690 [Streptococcus azizii]ONK30083.1 hypothetical protein BVE85_02000 [Streptococcus azizii]ONK30858.1 hypothetical protein BVE84_02000 [Streptococcus azizii]
MFVEHEEIYLFSELLARVQLVRYKARKKLKAKIGLKQFGELFQRSPRKKKVTIEARAGK